MTSQSVGPECVADNTDTGSLPVLHLKRYWSRILLSRSRQTVPGEYSNESWTDKLLLAGLGLGLQSTLKYLYTAPSLQSFEEWILDKNGGAIEPERLERLNSALARRLGMAAPEPPDVLSDCPPVLTASDLAFWDENGYVVLHHAVPPENCQAAEAAIWEFLNMDPAVPDTWYSGPHGHSIMVEIVYHHAFAENRRSRRIHKAFSQLWGTSDLWATVDRGGFNPPERPEWRFPGPHLHWDTSLATPIPFGVQGILYLTDTAADQGAFTCVPGFHNRIEDWLKGLPPGSNPREQDLSSHAVPIAGKAGDLVIWRDALPHGSSPNRAQRPRIVQYLTMFPTMVEDTRPWL